MNQDKETEILRSKGETIEKQGLPPVVAVFNLGVARTLFLVLLWTLVVIYFWLFGIGGGRFTLSFVIGIPAFITFLVFKDR